MIVLEGIHVSEVVSKEDKDVIGEIVLSFGGKIIGEHFTFCITVEVFGFLIVNPWRIAVKNIEIEA
jgi:hypothetical protein